MNGTRALALALLLCLVPLGGIVPGAAQDQGETMSVVSDGDGPGYLAPPSEAIDRTGQPTASIDVGAAVGANAGEVRSTYQRVALQRTYESAETAEERRAIVRNGTDDLVGRIDALESRERSAIERYGSGEIGESQLLRTLAVVDRRARTSEPTLDWLETRAGNLGMNDAEDSLARQRTRLRTLRGPVRATVHDALAGEHDSRVYVEISSDGIVLATVDRTDGGARYVREADDPSARTTDFDDRTQAGLSDAEERVRELYPWVTNNSTPTATPLGPDTARLWRFTYTHPHGNLETYLDAETERILLERQRLDPTTVPTTTVEESDGDLRVELNTTRAGGPLGVAVYDAATGEPVDAEITVDSDPVGTTGGDRLWTVAPRGETTINATYRGHTLTAETSFE